LEQTQRTKHIDKLRRAILEAIQAKHGDVSDKILNEKVETGMNEGGVAWIGDVRVAEMTSRPSGQNGKEFCVNASKISEEAKKLGWDIDGVQVVARYKELME
jgi:hypothetical protein